MASPALDDKLPSTVTLSPPPSLSPDTYTGNTSLFVPPALSIQGQGSTPTLPHLIIISICFCGALALPSESLHQPPLATHTLTHSHEKEAPSREDKHSSQLLCISASRGSWGSVQVLATGDMVEGLPLRNLFLKFGRKPWFPAIIHHNAGSPGDRLNQDAGCLALRPCPHVTLGAGA